MNPFDELEKNPFDELDSDTLENELESNPFDGMEPSEIEAKIKELYKGKKGQDGVGIESITQPDIGSILVTLTSGKTKKIILPKPKEPKIDEQAIIAKILPKIPIPEQVTIQKEARGILKSEKVDGELVIHYTDGTSEKTGIKDGEKGKDAKPQQVAGGATIGIRSINQAADGRIPVYNGDNGRTVRPSPVSIAEDGTLSGFVIDHGALTGLTDDDHPQYTKADGTRAFTGTVAGITPTLDAHLTTKGYVDGQDAFKVITATLAQSINGSSTYTWQIALGASDFTHGHAMVQNTNATYTSRTGALIFFTTLTGDSYGSSTNPRQETIATVYTVNHIDPQFYSNVQDSKISGSSFGSVSNTPQIQIDSAAINGSNLEIVLRNTVGTARTATCRALVYVRRGTKL